MKTFCAFAILLGLASAVSSQTRRDRKPVWQSFAPPGLGFKIDVPSKPQRVRGAFGDTDPNGYKSIDVFGGHASHNVGATYEIIVLLPSPGMRRENASRNELGGLEFTIGGDDAEPASELPIKMNGLHGKEFIYHFPDAKTLGHRKGRIIDAGRRVFVLIYATNTAAGLKSREATRFFNSFKVF